MRNMKADALLYAVNIAPQEGVFVEIGCIREDHEVPTDGYSTVYLARYCQQHGIVFESYDINAENVAMANDVLEREGLSRRVFVNDGVKALKLHHHEPISFLYLDSHRDPTFSMLQYNAAWLAPGSVVAIDDAHAYDDFKFGKATDLKTIFDDDGINYKILPTEQGFKMLIAKIPRGKKQHTLLSLKE